MNPEELELWERQRDALESMVQQFGYWSKGYLHTGGLSALEDAFEALGWDDPHPAMERCCDVEGCFEEATCGWPDGARYRRTCHEHMKR